jgi:hypothetical protein
MAVKFTSLNEITVPNNDDSFVLRDSNLNTTKYITWENIQLNILSEGALNARGDTLVNVLNARPAPNGLNATQVWHNTAYRNGDYFLQWANQLGKPALLSTLDSQPTFNLSQFVNNTGFVQWEDNNGSPRLKYLNTSTGTSPREIKTNDIAEGDENLYYTQARVDARITTTFPTELSRYTATFDQGNTADSLSNVSGTFLAVPGDTVNQAQANTIRVSSTLTQNFNVGQNVRVYGASDLNSELISSSNIAFTATPVGLSTTGAAFVTFSYEAAEFDIVSGEIAAAYGPVTVTIEVPEGYSGNPNDSDFVGNLFTPAEFIRLSFGGSTSTGRSVAVYRKDPTRTIHTLVAVLGPKDIAENDGWNDYYNLDYVSWANKSNTANEYTSVIHFPLTSPAVALRGWVDTYIRTKSVSGSNLDLVLGDVGAYVWTNATRTCQISHNDTAIIQNAITSNNNVGRKSITLNAKTYIVDQISIPDNFGLTGTAFLTKMKKLPWSGGKYTSSTMIRSTNTSISENISIVGVDIDGDASNQFLFTDTTNPFNNYLVNLYRRSESPLFDKVRVRNSIGGGVWATESLNFRFTNGEIINSGNTDRWDFSPLIADAGFNSIITSNVFRNYTDYVDVSVTDRAVVTNNIIENCGSGLFIYGSKFILSSPNILIGAADEFLPQPDILNSEYDSVNIYLSSEYINVGGDYESTIYVYQENGEIYDLTYTEGQDANGLGGISNIEYSAFLIAKSLTTGEEYFWDYPAGVLAPSLDPIPQVRSEGRFQFRISADDIERTKGGSGNLSINQLRGTGAGQNPDHVGIAYAVSYENEVRAATIPTSNDQALSGVRDPSSTSGTGLDRIYDTGVAKATGGEVTGSNYAIKVYNMSYLSLGSRVIMNQHTGFVANGNTSSGIGTISYISNVFPDGADTYNYVLINYPGTATFDIGDGGYINIIDKFVMAQGRIL